jgi:photosystem II stability/assembly factor-like uncharacterized protein
VGFSGTILKTTNGGLNWTSQQIGTSENLNSVHFIGQTGYAVGGANNISVILRTTNGGMNWESQSIAGTNRLNSVFMTNSVTAYAVGNYGKILRTTNGGTNWNVQNINTINDLSSIFFTDANTGYIGGTFNVHTGGTFLKTNDGGSSWSSYTGEGWSSIYFINSVTGYGVLGRNIKKTINSGTSWTGQSLEYGDQLMSIWFTNLTTGYVAGRNLSNNGRIYKTINEGLNWTMQSVPQTNELYSIFFINDNTGFTVGNSGTILKTTNGGVTGLVPVGNEIPNEYKLYQNYPNPFNPATNIKYQISKLSDVRLTVFDILGREIINLVNEVLKPGTYEVQWGASNYPSGVFFYKLFAGDFVETKKMVLVK